MVVFAYQCVFVCIGGSDSHISLKGGVTYREQCFPEFYNCIFLCVQSSMRVLSVCDLLLLLFPSELLVMDKSYLLVKVAEGGAGS